MKQLSGSDNIFLVGERNNVFNHVASLAVYDVSTAPGGQVRFRDILRHFEERIYSVPIFRRRLVTPPLGIDRPYWVEDDDIDVEFHIRHIALPDPGDWRQLMIQIARLHSRPLDRSKPMWEAYVIEGLDNIPKLPKGSFAVFFKIHHSLVDGMAGVLIAEKIHALSPDATGPSGTQIVRVDRTPSPLELFSRALANGVDRAGHLARLARRAADVVATVGREQLAGGAPLAPPKPPLTRFNAEVSGHRVVEGFGMPLSRIRRVRNKLPGISLNDIFLAVAGGGVRRYLTAKQELPAESLIALMPMSLRTDASEGGNAIGAGMVAVRTDIADPLARLRVARDEAAKAKAAAERMGADLLATLFDALPSALGNYIVNNVLIRSFNITVSNVRGPDKPLYMAGAKAMCLYPVSIPTNGAGLNITGVSYNGVMWVAAVACRNIVPDPGFLNDCLRAEWEAMLAGADALPDPGASAPAAKGKRHVAARPAKAAEAKVPGKRAKKAAPEPAPRATPGAAPRTAVAKAAKATARRAKPGVKPAKA